MNYRQTEEAEAARSNFVLVPPEDLQENEVFNLAINAPLVAISGKRLGNSLWKSVVETISETAKRKYVDRFRKESAMNRIFMNKISKQGFEIIGRRIW